VNRNPSGRRWPWLRGSGRTPPDQADVVRLPEGADDVDQALDLIAHILRLMGGVPIVLDDPDVASMRAAYEAWARHMLSLTPPPGGSETQPRHRAWGALRQFVDVRRHAEQERAAQGLADLRQAVLTIAGAVRGSLAQEESAGNRLEVVIERLQSAAVDAPIERLREEAHSAANELVKLAGERVERQQQLGERVNELSQEVQLLSTRLEQLQEISTRDSLTGLLNRAGFDTAIRRALLQIVPTGQRISLALIDLDDLKWINDHHGHGVGDAAIRALADSLRTICRGTDELARIGGDEFAAILPNADPAQAANVAQRFLHELWNRNLPVEDGVVRVSASVGIAEALRTDGPRTWMDRADQRLYRAKSMGKNRVLGEAPPTERGS
jgi:diguanylate cyclase